MSELFGNVLTASFHGSIVIAVVIVLRLLLKKTPKKFLCFLWLLAGIRLLMPFEIQSSLSLQPDTAYVAQQQWQQEPVLSFRQEALPEPSADPVAEPVLSHDPSSVEVPSLPAAGSEVPEQKSEPKPAVDWAALVPYFWFAVACCFGLSSLYSYLRLRYQVREAIKIPGGWECDRIDTAFILGFIRPQIYIPMGMSASNRKYILAHERTHLEKGDHWFKMIGYIALAIHWFNPLVWVAYTLLCKDIEMACDERVVQFMDLEERKRYSAALLSCSANRAHYAACPVAFGEVSVKTRIKSVLNYRKPSFWISLLGVIAILFVAVCLVTNPTKQQAEPTAGETISTEPDAITVKTVDELLTAIAPDTVIQLEPGTYNLSEAASYGKDSQYYVWGQGYDGYQLELQGIENLTIRGGGKLVTSLVTEPRYANVLALRNCSNVTLENFTAGHTPALGRGECSGGVVYLEGCMGISMGGLGLYGCGVTGLSARNCTEVSLTDSDIYDCTSSAVVLDSGHTVTVSGCRINNIGSEEYGGYVYFEVTNSQAVTISDCEITDSTVAYLACAYSSDLELRSNLFARNRTIVSAFSFNGETPVTLEGNKFEDNNIRTWYTMYTSLAVDREGNALTEEKLQSLYPAQSQEAAQTQLTIHAATVDELIAAIGPNREIVLDGALYDFSTATGYGTYKGDYYYWEDIYDGPGLVIHDVDNLTIRSSDGDVTAHTLSAVPRYADVLTFKACSNITLSGFTAGHTKEPGSCAGGVLEFRDSDGIHVDNCGLFGCGILGVYTEYCSNVRVTDCDIYECSQGGIEMRTTTNIEIDNCTFRDLGGDDTILIGCANITIDGQRMDSYDPVNTPAGVTAQADQADLEQMEKTALDFASAYFAGETGAMKLYLTSAYDRPVEGYETPGAEMTVQGMKPPLDYAQDMESRGCCLYSVLFGTAPELDGLVNLTMEMTREQGVWKVQYYTRGDTEIELLDRDLYNFFWAYMDQDLQGMELLLSDSYTQSVEVYFGDGGKVAKLDYSVGDSFTNAGLAELDQYVASIPFLETADSDSYTYLSVTLERRETKQTYDVGNGIQRTDSEWVVTGYGLEK